ncbi:MAG: DUF6782 family putative metallopeptidase, partial [Pseudomonadota bacterium]|nr:DUF6782 family putative metallopeptidase [Pseudomonadota bacterium]
MTQKSSFLSVHIDKRMAALGFAALIAAGLWVDPNFKRDVNIRGWKLAFCAQNVTCVGLKGPYRPTRDKRVLRESLKPLMASPLFRNLIDAAERDNAALCRSDDPQIAFIDAYYESAHKVISLPNKPLTPKMQATLLHELAHAAQFARLGHSIGDYDPISRVILNRFAEAGADADATLMAWQIFKETGDRTWLDARQKLAPDITAAFLVTARVDPAAVEDGRAWLAAFRQWFLYKPRTTFYDMMELSEMASIVDDLGDDLPESFGRTRVKFDILFNFAVPPSLRAHLNVR